MRVVVKDKREIYLIEGRKVAGDVVDIPDKIALRYLAQGAVERYETKVVRDAPFVGAGAEERSSASPAGQASTETTVSESDAGAMESLTYPVVLKLRDNPPTPEETIAKLAKRRGRPRKASSQ